MAANYTNVTIGGVSKEAIIVDGSAETERVILRERLSDYDETQMDVISDSAGASFFEKMENTTLSNGQTADVQYANFIKFTVDLDELASRQNFNGFDADAAQQATLDDHETRITALEP